MISWSQRSCNRCSTTVLMNDDVTLGPTPLCVGLTSNLRSPPVSYRVGVPSLNTRTTDSAMYGQKPLIPYDGFPVRCLLITLFFRLVDLVWVKGSYVPDEYWQSLEVAHRQAFGFGFLTWEWVNGVRSYLHPGMFAALYRLLGWAQIDTPELVVFAPRLLQALISALGDVYFLRWVAERRNGQYGWAFLSWITCTFVSYCSTRTLSNTLEMNLTTVALYYYPWTPKTGSSLFVLLVTLVCFIRPTAVVTWLPLVLTNIFTDKSPLLYFLTSYLPLALVVSMACVGFDSFMYGTLTITPWNFFKFNILQNIGSFYGTHDPVWYLYCGLPVVLGLHTVPFLFAVFKTVKRLRFLKYDVEVQLTAVVLWSVFLFSLCPHKEFRFLLPLVPMMIYLSSSVLSRWSSSTSYTWLYTVGTIIISVHTVALIYLGQFHQMGTLDTVNRLGAMARNNTKADILYLAPCHTFPGYSHLHTNVSTRHLTCKPNLLGVKNYVDEADLFYKEPVGWLKREFASSRPCTLPTHIVKFDRLNITNYLFSNNFTLVGTLFHSYYTMDDRVGENVMIYQRKGPKC